MFLRFQLFQLSLVALSVAFAVEHTNQYVFLMHVPQVNTVGYKLVEHT